MAQQETTEYEITSDEEMDYWVNRLFGVVTVPVAAFQSGI